MNIERERTFEQICDDPSTIVTICEHVANGGSLIDLAKVWQISYSKVLRWIRANVERNTAYEEALSDRKEWTRDAVLRELRAIAHCDIRQIFAADGSMLHPKQWPAEVAAAVAGLEIFEEFQGSGHNREFIGHTKKLKMWDKAKSLELIGKTEALFIDKHQNTGSMTLEQLLLGSYTPEELAKGSHNDGNRKHIQEPNPNQTDRTGSEEEADS